MAIKGIPYGMSDYERITLQNYYYVDKTRFIPLIEQAASYFFLIRPRRFGKSLMINVLAAYYDINNIDRFEELFGERYIYQHPTKLRGQFMILRFNFSAVSSNASQMLDSFEAHCQDQFRVFANQYEHLFRPGFREELMKRKTANQGLSYINSEASFLKLRIYLIIDEYDNFTNTILSSYGTEAYRQATHGEGGFRFFFNVIKEATTGNGMALERMFITGVSPITLDDVTSGFNIGSNLSTDCRFNGIIGFSEAELRQMLEYYKAEGAHTWQVDDLIETMKPWYDNYCFAKDSLGESMYNSDMVLYFLNHVLAHNKAPEEMIDKNIRTDYNKIRHLISIDRELGVNFSIIREIVETGHTSARINDSFSALEMTNPNNFKSLLYYFGMLTISHVEQGDTVLRIPNLTVREQFYTYLVESYQQTGYFTLDLNRLTNLMKAMAYKGDWKPVFAYIAQELNTQSRIREFIDGEAHIKGFMLAYLGLTNYYQIMPEWEANKGYADFYFQPSPSLPDVEYTYLLEVKYAKKEDTEAKIKALQQEAREQLVKYANDPTVKQSTGTARLRLISVTFRTWEIEAMEEVELPTGVV